MKTRQTKLKGVMVIDLQAWHRNKERKLSVVFSSDQVDIERLGPLVQVGEDVERVVGVAFFCENLYILRHTQKVIC